MSRPDFYTLHVLFVNKLNFILNYYLSKLILNNDNTLK